MFTFSSSNYGPNKLSPFEIQRTITYLSGSLTIYLLVILKHYNCAETSLHSKQFLYLFGFIYQFYLHGIRP